MNVHKWGLASLGREFLVAFVGLALALAVNSWWAQRQDRRAELEILREIRADLRTDSADVASNLGGLRRIVANADSIARLLDARAPHSPSFDTLATDLGRWVDHENNAAGYATLKSRGITLVTNDSLRRAIAQFYETTYGEEAQHDRIAAAVFVQTQPALHRYLRTPTYFSPPKPIDYHGLITDFGFRALVDELSEQYRSAEAYEESVAREVTRLGSAIDRELVARR
jgi:hypothetical protein